MEDMERMDRGNLPYANSSPCQMERFARGVFGDLVRLRGINPVLKFGMSLQFNSGGPMHPNEMLLSCDELLLVGARHYCNMSYICLWGFNSKVTHFTCKLHPMPVNTNGIL